MLNLLCYLWLLFEYVLYAYYIILNIIYILYCRDHTIGTTTKQGTKNYYSYFTSGAAVSMVEVDCLTGDHEV